MTDADTKPDDVAQEYNSTLLNALEYRFRSVVAKSRSEKLAKIADRVSDLEGLLLDAPPDADFVDISGEPEDLKDFLQESGWEIADGRLMFPEQFRTAHLAVPQKSETIKDVPVMQTPKRMKVVREIPGAPKKRVRTEEPRLAEDEPPKTSRRVQAEIASDEKLVWETRKAKYEAELGDLLARSDECNNEADRQAIKALLDQAEQSFKTCVEALRML